jgi:hypothetical protein
MLLPSKFSSVCDQATRVACNLFSPPEESPSSNVVKYQTLVQHAACDQQGYQSATFLKKSVKK